MPTQTRHISQVDTETGEAYAALAVVYPKRRNAFTDWLAMALDALDKLATMGLNLTEHRVFLALCARLDFDNLMNINQADLGRHLKIKPTNVGRAMRGLIAKGLIEQGPKVEGHRTFRLSPEVAWRGSAKSHHEAMRDRMKRARIAAVHTNDTKGTA